MACECETGMLRGAQVHALVQVLKRLSSAPGECTPGSCGSQATFARCAALCLRAPGMDSIGFGIARASPPPGDAKARCVLCSSWAKVRPSRIMFRLEYVKSPPEPLPPSSVWRNELNQLNQPLLRRDGVDKHGFGIARASPPPGRRQGATPRCDTCCYAL